MTEHKPVQNLEDIADAIDHIEKYLNKKTFPDFENDDLLFDAVMMRLQTIGESVAKLPEELKLAYPEIPWKQIIGLRQFISHAYAYLDAHRAWMVLESDLPKLKAVIKKMHNKL